MSQPTTARPTRTGGPAARPNAPRPTVNLFFDKRASKAGEGVVKYLVFHQGKQRLFTTGQKVSAEEWAFLQSSKGRLDNRIKDETKRALWQRFYGDTFTDEGGRPQTGYFKRALDIVHQLGPGFSVDAFALGLADYGKPKEQPRNGGPADESDLIAALQATAERMQDAGRISNANNYALAAKSLRRFVDSFSDEERSEFLSIPVPRKATAPRPVATLRFEHLTPDFLNTYEQWMQHYGKSAKAKGKPSTPASLTTVGIYLRHVRAVVNDAIDAGRMERTAYPFGRNRYVIPAGANKKKALAKVDIDKLKAFTPMPGTMEQRALDIWLFSYFSNGANLTDICRLTWDTVDLSAGTLTFIRQKTARSRKQNQKAITAHLRPETRAILDRWGTPGRVANRYVFPFLTADMDERQRKAAVHQTIKLTNKWMGRIAAKLGIDAEVNTYAARHSFATTLLKSKAPLAFISGSLGHSSIKTTEIYLGSFDDEEAKQILSAL